jgi:hypothetical protein
MSRRRFPWNRLGIDETGDSGAIRKAYADALRAMNVDEDVAGYAELRRARDHALWLAAEHRRTVEAGEKDGDEFGLGGLDDDDAAQGDAAENDWLDAVWDEDDAAWDEGPPGYRPAAAPGPEVSAAQAEAQAAWAALLAMLYPDGKPCEGAMTLAQMDEGLAALGTLLARAEAADVTEHDALDSALAELFARTWPRSAPFVEPAAEAFHWLDEAGSLEERPALRFLNERLRGMRFHAKVQEPDHPLHAAWVQLSQPGRARFADRLRVKRLDVYKLLTGIRRNFPELEQHLDPQRVASWDAKWPAEGAPGLVPRIIRGVFIVLLVVGFPRLIGNILEPGEDPGDPPRVGVERRLTEAELDTSVHNIFGTGITMASVRAQDPKLAREVEIAANKPEIIAPRDYVRMQALASAEVAPRAALVTRAELKAIWLTAALAQGGEVCRKLIAGKLGEAALDLSFEDRVREQGLLRKLLSAKVLSHRPTGGEVRYAVPGWLVEDARRRSGLALERLKAALGDPDSSDRCKAEAGLVAAAAAAPGKVPDEVLKGL